MTGERIRQSDREAVVAVFLRELPHTARLLNAPTVTEEIVFGPSHETPAEDELPPQEWYDRHEAVLDELVEDGILQTGEALGFKVYGLTVRFQEAYAEHVIDWMMHKVKVLRARAEEHGGASGDEKMRRAAVIEQAIGAIKATEEVKP